MSVNALSLPKRKGDLPFLWQSLLLPRKHTDRQRLDIDISDLVKGLTVGMIG